MKSSIRHNYKRNVIKAIYRTKYKLIVCGFLQFGIRYNKNDVVLI